MRINGYKLVTAASLTMIVGCSFHSAQLEGVKALWSMKFSGETSSSEIYWWDMEYKGESHRLFPIVWRNNTVLTDASRWMIVVRNSDILMIRDAVLNTQIEFEYLDDTSVGELHGLSLDEPRSPSSVGGGYAGTPVGAIAIKERVMGQSGEEAVDLLACHPPRFLRDELRLVRACVSGEQTIDLSVTAFDRAGAVRSVAVRNPLDKDWLIRRSDEVVNAFDIRRYVEGDDYDS